MRSTRLVAIDSSSLWTTADAFGLDTIRATGSLDPVRYSVEAVTTWTPEGDGGGDRAPLFDRRELDRLPLTRTSTTQPVGTVHTTHSDQNDSSQTRDLRQPGNGGTRD